METACNIANAINQYNPVANLWDVISYAFTNKDRFGNPISLTQANLKALAVVPIPIGKIGSLMMTADQIALKELVSEATLGGRTALSEADAQIVKELANEVNYPGFRASPLDLDPINNHWVGGPHIHIPGVGNGHISVEP